MVRDAKGWIDVWERMPEEDYKPRLVEIILTRTKNDDPMQERHKRCLALLDYTRASLTPMRWVIVFPADTQQEMEGWRFSVTYWRELSEPPDGVQFT